MSIRGLALAAVAATSSVVVAQDVVGLARGVARVTDLSAIPVVDFGSRNHYVGSIDPHGANADWDWGEAQDENGEWILFEDEGPGCVYNFTQHRGEDSPVPVFRFYFDGETSPRLVARPKDFGATVALPKPLADAFTMKTHDGHPFRIVRSYIPMEYRKGCRITSSIPLRWTWSKDFADGGWGHVMYHHYDSDAGLATYDPKRPVPVAAERLPDDGVSSVSERTLAVGSETELYTEDGRGTLVETALELPVFDLSFVTNLWLAYEFDGVRTVEAPIGTFFGCETPGTKAKLRTTLVTFDTAESGARLANRFPMPYFRSCRVLLRNRGAADLSFAARVAANHSLQYDEKTTGVFTASPYCPKIRNEKGRNARIGRLVGRGLMAYGTISGYEFMDKPSWGACEGDVRCFIDDMTVPRVQSDGSESWGSWGLGFAVGGSSNPFSCYDIVRHMRKAWSELRLTYADAYVFRRFVRFDLEHGCANDHPESSSSGQIFGYVLKEGRK